MCCCKLTIFLILLGRSGIHSLYYFYIAPYYAHLFTWIDIYSLSLTREKNMVNFNELKLKGQFYLWVFAVNKICPVSSKITLLLTSPVVPSFLLKIVPRVNITPAKIFYVCNCLVAAGPRHLYAITILHHFTWWSLSVQPTQNVWHKAQYTRREAVQTHTPWKCRWRKTMQHIIGILTLSVCICILSNTMWYTTILHIYSGPDFLHCNHLYYAHTDSSTVTLTGVNNVVIHSVSVFLGCCT